VTSDLFTFYSLPPRACLFPLPRLPSSVPFRGNAHPSPFQYRGSIDGTASSLSPSLFFYPFWITISLHFSVRFSSLQLLFRRFVATLSCLFVPLFSLLIPFSHIKNCTFLLNEFRPPRSTICFLCACVLGIFPPLPLFLAFAQTLCSLVLV